MQLLIAAGLVVAGCRSTASGCADVPEESFTIAEDLDEATVMALLDVHGVGNPSALECEDVCTFLSEGTSVDGSGSDGIVLEIETCALTIDSELTGDATAIVGDVQCTGRRETYYCTGGRRPLGHVEQPLVDAGLPAYLAHCARLEAASVLAFTQLADRLHEWRAPGGFVERCRHAAAQEARHAAQLADLAHETGATVEPATATAVSVDLACAALDNAVEGCVHEAWSALTCAVTAQRAATPVLREVYARLADDEAAHAQLAWDLHTWFMGQVSADQRAAIVAAQQAAIAGLPALARAQHQQAPAALGVPDARVAAHFAAALAA